MPVGAGAVIGPFARLRPGTVVGAGAHVGNFVELKAAVLGEGAKANHLSYIGDATVGARTNIGAGTITVNYDGFEQAPHGRGRWRVHRVQHRAGGPGAVGDGAMVVAGSTVTEDVPADAMAFGRARQVTKPGRAARSGDGKGKR